MVVPCVGMRMGDVMHLDRSRVGRAEANWTRIHGFGRMMVRMVIVVLLLWLLLLRMVNGRSLAVWDGRWG